MRYDTPVIFTHESESYYDFDLGERVPGQFVTDKVMGNVTDLGTEMSVKVFGSIKENALVVRLLRHYTQPFDYLVINGRTYTLLKSQKLRQKHTLIIQEVVR